jgi:hypothetical protein
VGPFLAGTTGSQTVSGPQPREHGDEDEEARNDLYFRIPDVHKHYE